MIRWVSSRQQAAALGRSNRFCSARWWSSEPLRKVRTGSTRRGTTPAESPAHEVSPIPPKKRSVRVTRSGREPARGAPEPIAVDETRSIPASSPPEQSVESRRSSRTLSPERCVQPMSETSGAEFPLPPSRRFVTSSSVQVVAENAPIAKTCATRPSTRGSATRAFTSSAQSPTDTPEEPLRVLLDSPSVREAWHQRSSVLEPPLVLLTPCEQTGLGVVASPHYGLCFKLPLDMSSSTGSYDVQGGDVAPAPTPNELLLQGVPLHVSAR